MIQVRTEEEIKKLRKSAQLLVKTFQAVESELAPGVPTERIDKMAEEVILSDGGKPAFKGYKGYQQYRYIHF